MRRTEEQLVSIRNNMTHALHDAIADWSEDKEDRAYLVNTLNKISKTKGFTVDTRCNEPFFDCGIRYDDVEHIKIVEERQPFIIRIFPNNGSLDIQYNHYMLQTKAELEAEAKAEMEAEQAMSA